MKYQWLIYQSLARCPTLILLASIATGVLPGSAHAEQILYTNILGYQYTTEVPERLTQPERTARAPRIGYWASFGAFLIDNDGRIKQLYSQTPGDEELTKLGPELRVIDGKGRTVLPGLIDAHGHVLSLGQRKQRVDLVGTSSVQDAQRRILEFVDSNEQNGWVLGRGWNQVLWPSKEFPRASDLDEIVPRRPVYLNRIDGHAAWANSAALKAANINALTKDPQGGQIIRDDSGQPTGVLIDSAMNLVEAHIPAPDSASIIQALKFAQEELRRMGITSAHDAGVGYSLAKLYRKLARDRQLTVRIYAMVAGAGEHLRAMKAPWPDTPDDLFAIRSVKLYADGALGSRGAALLSPYADKPGHRGLLFSPYDELQVQIERAAQLGFQVNVHAIGDAANRQVLDIYGRLPNVKAGRHRIEHAQVIALDDLQRFAEYGVIAAMQPTHATSDMNMAEDRVGPERIKGAYAWRRLLDLGVIIAGGSDFPVELSNPFHGLYAAVTRRDQNGQPQGGWYADQSMTRAEALRAFTVDAAYAAHQESRIGNLRPGYWADFIVIDQDYFTVPDEQLFAIEVQETWLAGERVFAKGDD